MAESKFEIRISKSETNPNIKCSKQLLCNSHAAFVLDLEFLSFEFVSNFGFRASDFRLVRIRR